MATKKTKTTTLKLKGLYQVVSKADKKDEQPKSTFICADTIDEVFSAIPEKAKKEVLNINLVTDQAILVV